MTTKKTAKSETTDETKPKKTAAKKAPVKRAPKADAKPKVAKKAAKIKEPEAAAEPEAPLAPEPVGVELFMPPAKKMPKPAPNQGLGLTPHAVSILSAIHEGRAVEFIFADADANAPRTFEPRQLTFDGLSQAWYAWGWDRRYNAERFHRLDLLAEVNPVEGVGRSAQGPYKEDTPGNMIGGWLGGDPIAVKVILHKQWVFAVKQAPPAFPEFVLEEKEEGKAAVSFTATDLRAIARWVMQFGDGITIVEPARLVDRIRQTATAWGAKLPAPKAGPAPAAPAPRSESRHQEPRAQEPRHHEPRHQEPRHHEEPRRREQEERGPKPGQKEIRIERL